MTFQEFLLFVRAEEQKGTIKFSKNLTDYDIAVYYATSLIGNEKGYPCEITVEEIADKIREFAPELL